MTTVTVDFDHSRLIRDAKRALLGLALFVGAVGVAHCGTGCLPAQAPTVEEQGYTADIVACAYFAGYPGPYDHQADMECRDKVNCRYHVGPCPDGGK